MRTCLRLPHRARPHTSVTALGISLFVSLLALGSASAQERPSLDEFSTQRFAPVPGPHNYLSTDGALVQGHLSPSVGLLLDYAHKPFVLYNARCQPDDATDCEIEDERTTLVQYALTANVLASLTLVDRVQIGLVLPVAINDSDEDAFTGSDGPISVGGEAGFGLGDPRLSAKVRLYGERDDALRFAVAVFGSAPLGQATAEGQFLGDDGPTFGGHGIGEFEQKRFRLAANVGAMWRSNKQLYSTEVGSQIQYRIAAGYDITPLLHGFLELEGASTFTTEVDENPMEGRVGARLRQGDFAFTLAGGTGLVQGVGVPQFRVLGGILWAPERIDSDGDGLLDEHDNCPAEPEDKDGFADEDGCPEPDNDNDGLLDAQDRCPDDPEDNDGFEDEDGCPDTDNDGDGVADGYDSCPADPEDIDGDRDEDGCPDDDTDRDGIPDSRDECPNDPEDTDGYGDDDGCPEDDFDHDGVPDDRDECPDQPEVINGVEDEDGCPEADGDGDGIPDAVDRCPGEPETLNGVKDDDGCPDGEELVRQEGARIQLLQQVQFQTDKANIRGRRSFQILDAVATILKRNPQYSMVRIEGHTDDRGSREHNMALSQARAESCMSYLVKQGIEANRLRAVGFGPDRPLEGNTSSEARAINRRVEFHIEAGATREDAARMGAAVEGPGQTVIRPVDDAATREAPAPEPSAAPAE